MNYDSDKIEQMNKRIFYLEDRVKKLESVILDLESQISLLQDRYLENR